MSKLQWKVHTPNLLAEVLNNPTASILTKPIQILGGLLYEVAERAAELNDPMLNQLMLRLTLYSAGDPESSDYDPSLLGGNIPTPPTPDASLLDPDMPSQELRLHMGELTAQEERTARAAIRWANSRCLKPDAKRLLKLLIPINHLIGVAKSAKYLDEDTDIEHWKQIVARNTRLAGDAVDRITDLLAMMDEVERLREALAAIACRPIGGGTADYICASGLQRLAREALTGQEAEGRAEP